MIVVFLIGLMYKVLKVLKVLNVLDGYKVTIFLRTMQVKHL
jgi:hypothetical protein